LKTRKDCEALGVGEYTRLEAPEEVLAFERKLNDQRVICVFNLGADPVRWALPGTPKSKPLLAVGTAEVRDGEVVLDGPSALLVEI
jgi:alpha-glucosidase